MGWWDALADRDSALRGYLEAANWLGTIAAGVFAGLIFFEARTIRRVEWFSKSSANWQDFNRLILELGLADRWDAISRGLVPWEQISKADLLLIYSFLNVLVFEYNAVGSGLLKKSYAEKSISENIRYFAPIWHGLQPHLRVDGWPDEFLQAADEAIRVMPTKA